MAMFAPKQRPVVLVARHVEVRVVAPQRLFLRPVERVPLAVPGEVVRDVQPELAAWLPGAFFGVLGSFLLYRVRT